MAKNNIEHLLPDCLLHSEIYSLVITDLDGRYIYVNDVFKNRFSFISENFIGQSSFVAIYPEDHDKCLQAVRQVLQHPDKVVKVTLRKPDTSLNDFYWTEWEFSLFKDQDKNPVGILCLGYDITETEKASKQAKEFAQKVETIIEEITDGFYVLNREWEFIKINKVAERILGLSREKLLGRRIWDLFPDTSEYNYPAQFRKSMSEYVAASFKDYRADLDRWFSMVCYPSQEGLTVFFRDVSQERKNHIALEDTSKKLKAILESTLDSYILISPEYEILHFNHIAENLAEHYAQKPLAINEDIRLVLAPESKESFDKLFHKALQGEKSVIEITRKIGEQEIWFEAHYLPVFEANTGELIGVTLKTVNIDDRKKAELQLKQSEVMLRALYDSSSEAITFIDRDFRVVFNNKLAKEITKNISGKAAQVGDYSLDYYVPDLKAEFADYYQRVLQGETFYIEKAHCGAWWAFSLSPVYDNEHNIVGISDHVKDITTRKENELKILKQNQTLHQIAWQQSHELRRPVANILGLCDLLKNYPNETKEIQAEYIDYMIRAITELDQIIHKIVSQANESDDIDVN